MLMPNLSIVFRADASLTIGSGHVMRCLTLAEEFGINRAQCKFVCKKQEGDLISLIESRGFSVSILSSQEDEILENDSNDNMALHDYLPKVSWRQDAQDTLSSLKKLKPDWIIVDHYALDYRWEELLIPNCRKMMVIDDLGDRKHRCDILLDQNLGRHATNYEKLVPDHCRVLAGTEYALLRPEFFTHRPLSLVRRKDSRLERILITMGGVDSGNVTSMVLETINTLELPDLTSIHIVLGSACPWIEEIRALSSSARYQTEVFVDVRNIAELMSECDLAIGAAGSTSWERCCLGVPTVLMVLAPNQKEAAHELINQGAAECVRLDKDFAKTLARTINELSSRPEKLRLISKRASALVDGRGLERVMGEMNRMLPH